MRRVPDGSPRRRRRARASETAADPGARNRRHGARARRGRDGLRRGRPRRCSVARIDMRPLCVLRDRPRKPVRYPGIHRLYDRRRLRGAHRRRPSVLRASAAALFRSRGRAAAVRRPDRLSNLAHGGRCASHRHLRLRRGSASRRAGCACRGAEGVRADEARRYGRAATRAVVGRGVGRRQRRGAAGAARCRAHLRAGGCTGAGRAAGA
ncbi:hypothetical protein BLA17378_02803 [Burkholderia aenigmatica]|uniref:LigA n=1 Tax=Burkholderia aenigmatica TaxID=2015348 RepID=A0ABY6XQK8_9BURK|nr:hypothetical protein BLA17378_02803 [Burkholderia aenigmatica]VWC89409.1 hypothetical protein BLA18628_01752 [Burkholderia aenigmatica]